MTELRKKGVLVTGGGGFLGRSVSGLLEAAGAAVRVEQHLEPGGSNSLDVDGGQHGLEVCTVGIGYPYWYRPGSGRRVGR